MRHFARCLVVGAMACALSGCNSGSPDKTYQTWSVAVKSGNFPAIWANLSPQARGTLLQIQVLDADALAASSSAASMALDQAYAKFGTRPQDPGFKQQRLQVTDPAGLAYDLDNIFRQFSRDLERVPNSRYRKLQAIWSAAATAALSPSQIQGTRATAAVQGQVPVAEGNASVVAVFDKVNGQWLMTEFEEAPAATTMAGGPGAVGGPGMAGPAGAGAMPGMPAAPMAGGPGAMPGMQTPMAGAPGAMPPGAMPPGGPMPPAMAAVPAGAAGDPKMLAGGPMPPMMAARPTGGPAGAGAMPAGTLPNPKMLAGGAMPAGAKPAGAMPAAPVLMSKNGDAKMAGGTGRPAGAGAIPGAGDPKMLAGAGGSQPGAMPDGPGGAGGGGQNQFNPGTFEYAVMTLITNVNAGEYAGLDAVISPKARGVLAEIRDLEANSDTIEEMKTLFADVQPQADSVKKTTGSISVTLKSEGGPSILLTVVKEKGTYRVKEMKVTEAKESNRR